MVLLYATCTLNASYLSPYNSAVAFTPNLERFAREALVFERHETEAGMSGIAFASIFTGQQAPQHGAFRQPVRLSDDLYLISEAYADQGYETFMWGGHPNASPNLNYAQGVPSENIVEEGLQADHPLFVELLERLASDPSYRAVVITNFSVTHTPYSAASLDSYLSEYQPDTAGMTREELQRYVRIHQRNNIGLQWNFPDTLNRLGLEPADLDRLVLATELLKSGSSGIRVGMCTGLIGVQVKAAEVEVDGLAEPLTASKARGLFLEPLDA